MKTGWNIFAIVRMVLATTLLGGLWQSSSEPNIAAMQIDIHGPSDSGKFGFSVTPLPNGNLVVTDPGFSGVAVGAGAVYLYNGASGTLISTLTGKKAWDLVGSGEVIVLSNGNYVVNSPYWDNGPVYDAGAVTWGNGTIGVTGTVSVANSLVGTSAEERIGQHTIALSNGNYVVGSPWWDNGTMVDAGAATWGNGAVGVSGAISAVNSLVGGMGDQWTGMNVTPLSNGNYVVISSGWRQGAAAATWGDGASGVTGVVSAANSLMAGTMGWNAIPLSNGNYVLTNPNWNNGLGAVTWADGASRITGTISAANSLVGTTQGDWVGLYVTLLNNGNYVVRSANWNNGAGAVTWGNGMSGVHGVVSAANSLVGSTANDRIGGYECPDIDCSGDVTSLSNGNYVVSSPDWDNGANVDAGAVTWGDGTTGITGVVSTTNSLVGSAIWDQVGYGVTSLSNGNYVVRSPYWNSGAGAITWEDGTTGVSDVVSTTNSLVGKAVFGYQVGDGGVTPLSNGNYVVSSPSWNISAGAVTWGNGTTGITGEISSANSLVGSVSGDGVGTVVTPLSNGNYVVSSRFFDNSALQDVGAVTWGNGTTGTHGVVSPVNSLVGSAKDDQVGGYWCPYDEPCYGGVTPLSNGDYVVGSPIWNNGAVEDAGAATWRDGASGASGVVSVANSLVGSTTGDQVGYHVTALSNGNYVVSNPYWDNGVVADAGAISLGFGLGGISGPITKDNSVCGALAASDKKMVFQYDSVNRQLVVGRPADAIVTLFRLLDAPSVFLPFVSKAGILSWRNP